ncbi:MAG: T9SS type A sorting domain-containing protein [Calditrichae bacterium]|nr:T9SS type A sorting domain-containing protein [Calditrichia bacterium]
MQNKDKAVLNKSSIHLLSLLWICLFIFVSFVQAEQEGKAQPGKVMLKGFDGSVMQLDAASDDDGDGIDNALEVNGFTYSILDGLQPWDGDTSKVYYVTDPLRWSTDGDPYSDFMEVTGINMPAAISAPENHPLVAARPIISIKMSDYDVIPLATITNTSGGEQSNQFTTEVSNSDEVGASVTVEAELNPFKLVGGSATASYSHTWTKTESNTSSFGTNWSNTRSTQPDQAARLKLRIYMENMGGATALDVSPTINLKVGKKTIATFVPSQVANILTPPGTSDNRFPKNGTIVVEKDDNNNDIIITLDELKSIQMGTPLSLEVVQVDAKVVRWNSTDQDWNSDIEWASFESEINPVSVEVLAELGNGESYRYEVFAGTPYWDPQYTFKDIASLIFNVTENSGETMINNRKYPDKWYLSSPTAALLNEWESQGRPQNLLSLRMFRNSKVVMMSPGNTPQSIISLASYTGDYKNVLVSALPNNFPILSVEAEVTINGQKKTIPLMENDNSFYESAAPFEEIPEGPGTVKVTNARGDVSTAPINLPAIYTSAADVKEFSNFLPDPGAEYYIYPNGNDDQPMLIYCLFYDPETHTELSQPREYLTVRNSGDQKVFSDYLAYTEFYRFNFTKLRINPKTLKLALKDPTFTESEILIGQGPIPTYINDDAAFGRLTWTYPEVDSGYAQLDLSGTPYHFAPENKFTSHIDETISIDRKRQKLEIKRRNILADAYNYYNYAGITDDSLQLVYSYDEVPVGEGLQEKGNALNFNQAGDLENSGYVRVFPTEAMQITGNLTMEAWIYATGPGMDPLWGGIVMNNEGRYELARTKDGLMRWAINNGNLGWNWQATQFKLPENQWLHIAVVYDQSTVKTYINGTLFSSIPGTGVINDYHTTNNQFWIGGRQNVSQQRFQGLIDEVRVWNRARTASEIKTTYNDTLSAKYYATADSGLVGYWRLDETDTDGEGVTIVKDFSVNDSPGQLWGDVELSGLPTKIADLKNAVPGSYILNQNYPNPFNPVTTISYNLNKQARINLTVYNLMGQQVKTLVNDDQPAGNYKLLWNGLNELSQAVASGTYIYRMVVNGQTVQSRKMILVR